MHIDALLDQKESILYLDFKKVEFLNNLKKGLLPEKSLKLASQKLREALIWFYPPVVFVEKNKYFLCARHWSYLLQITDPIKQLRCCTSASWETITQFLGMEQSECTMIETHIVRCSKISSASSATIARHKAIAHRRICPFCGNALLASLGNPAPNGKGLFKISCFGLKNGNRCDYYNYLTAYEYELFKHNKYPTAHWSQRVPNKKCPKCNSEIYLRLFRKDSKSIEHYEHCKYYNQSAERTCTYIKKVSK